MEDLTQKQKLLIHLNEVKIILESCNSLDDEEIAYYQNFNAIIFEDILKPMVDSNKTVT
tara:strand:- start:397 stop:573 length:177 start_codon:yes stop_codon:yes gene_type:complete